MSNEVRQKILVVEDENSVREGIVEGLSLEGYDVCWRTNGQTGIEAFNSENPDLVILDLIMPQVDGFQVCKEIRYSKSSVPIIILTAKSGEVDKVLGLELGADDYLTKPFGMRELFARVKAVLRRTSLVKTNGSKIEEQELRLQQEVQFGDVYIDFKTYRAKKGTMQLNFSAKEFELLRYLASNPDIPVTRNELLDNVWGYNSYPTTRTVDNFIARIRGKVEDVPDDPQHILTVHGVGYKFVQ